MPKITYEDYEYASEEEKNKDKDTQRSMDYSEDEGSDSASNDGNPLDEAADVDEYAAFATDLEKYNYDLRKWNDIQNTRKYVTKKKKNKGEDERKQEHDVEEGTKRPGKSRKLPNSLEEETPTQDPTVQNPEEEGIDFDATGNMWYSYHKDSVFICGKYREDRKFRIILLIKIRTRYISSLDSCSPESDGELHRDLR